MTAGQRPAPAQRFGPEPWGDIAGQSWSLWDLWFCTVAARGHDDDPEALAATFVETLRSLGASDSDANEARLSHLTDLALRLGEAGGCRRWSGRGCRCP